MAIKITQGLIDVSRVDTARQQTPTRSDVRSATSTTPSQLDPHTAIAKQARFTSEQVVSLVTVAAHLPPTSEAAVSLFRNRPSSVEAAKIREPGDADEVAESVAERVASGDEEGEEAHDLHPSSGRSHLTH